MNNELLVLPPEDPTETDSTTDSDITENTEPSTTTSFITTTSPINLSQSSTYIWMSLSILFFLTSVVTLAGIYYFIWLYRKAVSMLPIISDNVKTVENLPRLKVKNSETGDMVIVGMETRD